MAEPGEFMISEIPDKWLESMIVGLYGKVVAKTYGEVQVEFYPDSSRCGEYLVAFCCPGDADYSEVCQHVLGTLEREGFYDSP